jgi:hypothetical protein
MARVELPRGHACAVTRNSRLRDVDAVFRKGERADSAATIADSAIAGQSVRLR